MIPLLQCVNFEIGIPILQFEMEPKTKISMADTTEER